MFVTDRSYSVRRMVESRKIFVSDYTLTNKILKMKKLYFNCVNFSCIKYFRFQQRGGCKYPSRIWHLAPNKKVSKAYVIMLAYVFQKIL